MPVQWEVFLPYVLEDTREVPKNYAEAAVRDATIEFCKESFLWYMRSLPSDLLVGQTKYAFQVPVGTKVIKIRRLEFYSDPTNLTGRSEIYPITYDDLVAKFPTCSTDVGPVPQFYWGQEPEIITLYPKPEYDVIGSLFAEVALAPTRDAVECPTFIFENYADVIGFGAKARLMTSMNKPWSNVDAGLMYENKFRAGITRAESGTRKSQSDKPLGVKPRVFGGTR